MSPADHPKSAGVKRATWKKRGNILNNGGSVRQGALPVFLSVFDLFKIGIGPSSSHTMGPMTAAARFLDEIAVGDWPRPAGAKVDRIAASLHGSLAYTGIGHGTDRAVILGLAGETPQTVDPDKTDAIDRGDRRRRSASRRPAIRPTASIRPRTWCSTRRRRCPATPTAWPSTPTMPATGCCSSASTIRSAAASSSRRRSCSG